MVGDRRNGDRGIEVGDHDIEGPVGGEKGGNVGSSAEWGCVDDDRVASGSEALHCGGTHEVLGIGHQHPTGHYRSSRKVAQDRR